jgi:hypothetical protein
VRLRPTVRIGPADVGLSRTAARTLVPDQPQIEEIALLHVDAIATAQRSIYIESQYFGARAVHQALVQRLRQRGERLDVAIVCPRELHSFTERMAMQDAQDAMFRDVIAAAAEGGHDLGIYHVMSRSEDRQGGDKTTYIHSKVMIVDDRFVTVGSANLNNRSLGLDTELNVSWEVLDAQRDRALARAIRRARVTLLAEHAGLRAKDELRPLYAPRYVRYLDRLAAAGSARLCRHPVPPSPSGEPAGGGPTMLDPDRPLEAIVFEPVAPSRRENLAAGVHRMRRRFGTWRRNRRRRRVNPPGQVGAAPNPAWVIIVRALRRWLLPVLVLAVAAGLVWAVVALVRWLL